MKDGKKEGKEGKTSRRRKKGRMERRKVKALRKRKFDGV